MEQQYLELIASNQLVNWQLVGVMVGKEVFINFIYETLVSPISDMRKSPTNAFNEVLTPFFCKLTDWKDGDFDVVFFTKYKTLSTFWFRLNLPNGATAEQIAVAICIKLHNVL